MDCICSVVLIIREIQLGKYRNMYTLGEEKTGLCCCLLPTHFQNMINSVTLATRRNTVEFREIKLTKAEWASCAAVSQTASDTFPKQEERRVEAKFNFKDIVIIQERKLNLVLV